MSEGRVWRHHLTSEERAVVERAEAVKREWRQLKHLRELIVRRAAARARRAAAFVASTTSLAEAAAVVLVGATAPDAHGKGSAKARAKDAPRVANCPPPPDTRAPAQRPLSETMRSPTASKAKILNRREPSEAMRPRVGAAASARTSAIR